MTTLAPTLRPINTFTSRLISEPVEPTAASAWAPAKRPTTTISAALYKSCRMPVRISGPENISTLGKSAPVVMSIS